MILGWGRYPGEGEQLPTPEFLPGKFHEQNLVGYSPWGHKELDMTKGPTLAFFFSPISESGRFVWKAGHVSPHIKVQLQ